MVNRIRLFRHKGKFYGLNSNKKFKVTLNQVMIRAREEYKDQWRSNAWRQGGQRPSQGFHDDYMRMKQWMGTQTFYVISNGVYYGINGNTAEFAIAYPMYQIDEQTRDIMKTDTCFIGRLSSAMLDTLEPLDAFPREEGGTVTPGEKYNIMRSTSTLLQDTYRDYKAVAGRDADIFLALHGPEHRGMHGMIRYQMYGTGFHYSNSYDNGYNYLDGKLYSHREFLKEMDRRIREEQIAEQQAQIPEVIAEQDAPTITVTQHIPSGGPVEPAMVEVHNAVSTGAATPVSAPVAEPDAYYPGPRIYGPRDYAGDAYISGEPYHNGEPVDIQTAIDIARQIEEATSAIGYTTDNNGDLTL